MDRDRLRACAAPDLIDTAGQLAVAHAATHACLLDVLGVIDERELWRADGCVSFVDWIVLRFGVARKTAHEWAEAALVLRELPHLARAYGDGELSWDKTKAVAAIATGESDETLTVVAKTTDATRLETAARRARAVSLAEAELRHRARFLALRRNRALGGMKLTGFLPDADGETVFAALQRLADDIPKDADTGFYGSFDERCADALVDLCSGRLAADQQLHGERAMVVAHVDLTPEGSGGILGRVEVGAKMSLAPETMARLMCDAAIDPHFEINDATVGLGQTTRQPRPRLRRYVADRDVGCRFPGCNRTRLVQCHHQVHWPAGGPTQPDNLVGLCRYHHRKMHEGGWSLLGSPEGTLEFVKPNGEVLISKLPQMSDEVKRRILGPVLPDGP